MLHFLACAPNAGIRQQDSHIGRTHLPALKNCCFGYFDYDRENIFRHSRATAEQRSMGRRRLCATEPVFPNGISRANSGHLDFC